MIPVIDETWGRCPEYMHLVTVATKIPHFCAQIRLLTAHDDIGIVVSPSTSTYICLEGFPYPGLYGFPIRFVTKAFIIMAFNRSKILLSPLEQELVGGCDCVKTPLASFKNCSKLKTKE